MADALSFNIIPKAFNDPRTGQPTSAAQRFLLELYTRSGGAASTGLDLANINAQVQQQEIINALTLSTPTQIMDSQDFRGGINAGGFLTYQSGYFTLSSGISLSANNISINSTAGTVFGISTAQKVAFFGGTPTARPSAYTQTYSAATKTQSNLTSSTYAATPTNIVPWGLSSSAEVLSLISEINNLRNDIINVKQVLNAVIDDLQSLGLGG